MFNLGWLEVSLIILAAVLIFGPKRLPELGGSIGKALKGFKAEIRPTSEKEDPNVKDE